MTVPAYDGQAAAAFVIMSPKLKQKPVLFVEGPCEVKLIAHHFPEHEEQIVSCCGHSGVKEAVKTIEKWESANETSLIILGFIDRDYGQHNKLKRITFSRYRDVEIDMYKSNAGKRLLKEKASKRKCPDAQVALDEAINELRIVGLIRKFNSETGSGWKINDIKLGKCLDANGKILIERFLLRLQQLNSLTKTKIDILLGEINSCDDVETEDVIRGHDLSIVLGKWLKRKIGHRSKAETEWGTIEENLRLATDSKDLLKYNWARRIKSHFLR